jgi:hypothetical protein
MDKQYWLDKGYIAARSGSDKKEWIILGPATEIANSDTAFMLSHEIYLSKHNAKTEDEIWSEFSRHKGLITKLEQVDTPTES